jgi:mycofactocin glycosyltransferase
MADSSSLESNATRFGDLTAGEGQMGWYSVDRRTRRIAGGRVLVGGAPSRMIRLSAQGSKALDDLLAGRQPAPGGPADRLRRRLLDAGLVHPVAERRSMPVTTVVPVRDGGPALGRLVADLARHGEVIVVDDRSRDGSADIARAAGARVLANAGAPGPSGARNTGLAAVETDLVAFADADCEGLGSGWSAALAGLLADDPDLALVAPRVRSVPGSSAVARYETACSPLDLGADPSLVGPGRRIAYLPSAALVGRRSALLAVGGFDERLTVGEDVDLVWRLLAAGWSARYAPEVEVLHRPRPTALELARQRYRYGRSAATLQRLHPGAATPLRASRAMVAVWLACLTGPRAGALAVAAVVANVARLAPDRAARRALAALALSGQLESSRQLARVLAREWLPLGAALAPVSPRARRALALALVADVAGSRRRGAQRLAPPARAGLRALDNVSYCAGLWRGVAGERSLAALSATGPHRPPDRGGSARRT